VHLVLSDGGPAWVDRGEQIQGSAWKEVNKLRFEVNGQLFFVNFVPEEGRWYCYAPTATGVQRVPVSTDAAPFEVFAVPADERTKEIVN
jgi:hypothetical protein